MARPRTQAALARKLRREQAWIADDPDAGALAQQLVYLAEAMDNQATTGEVSFGTAVAYLNTRSALLALRPGA